MLTALAFDLARPALAEGARAIDVAARYPRLYRPYAVAWIVGAIGALFTLVALFMQYACFATLNALLDPWFGLAASKFAEIGGACATRYANVLYLFHVALPFLMLYAVAHAAHVADYFGVELYRKSRITENRIAKVTLRIHLFYFSLPIMFSFINYFSINYTGVSTGVAIYPRYPANFFVHLFFFTVLNAALVSSIESLFIANSIIKQKGR